MAAELNQPSTETEQLIVAVDELRDELQVVRQVIDDLREVVDYLSRNPADDHWRITDRLPVTSMPIDVSAEDFGERINTVPNATRDKLRQALPDVTDNTLAAKPQRDLF